MDALFHFVFQLVGGYVLIKGLNARFNIFILIFLAFCSLLVDVEHVLPHLASIIPPLDFLDHIKFHTIFIVFIPLLILSVLYFIKKGTGELYSYLLAFSVMLLGHLIADMITGMYGIPLFYPFSDTLYMIPKSWEVPFFGDPYMFIVSTYGIAMLIYFGGIGAIIFLEKILRKKYTKRRPSR